MRHKPAAEGAETATEMDAQEITFEDLLTEEPAETAEVSSFAQLLAEGFPRRGGLAELAAIARMADPDPRFAALQHGFLQILEAQNRAPAMDLQVGAGTQRTFADCPTVSKREAVVPDPTSAV